MIQQKIRAGRLEGRLGEVQLLGRLLSTRHKPVHRPAAAGCWFPEGFREFLGVEPGDEVVVLGAAVCIEIWKPAAWIQYLDAKMPKFRRLFDDLSK